MPDERRVYLRLTDRGAAPWEAGGCLAGALVARSGLARTQLPALNTDIPALRDALTERQP